MTVPNGKGDGGVMPGWIFPKPFSETVFPGGGCGSESSTGVFTESGIKLIADDQVPHGWMIACWSCEYCGESNIAFFHFCGHCRFRRGPDNVWRIIGRLGPRADGRTYYIWGNNATNEVHYTWDKWFWHGVTFYDTPGTIIEKLIPGYTDLSYLYNALLGINNGQA